jgi:hypothetical protein
LDNTMTEKEWTTDAGVLLRQGLVYVPEGHSRVQLLQAHHDGPLAGHKGHIPTLELISRNYWFPQMAKYVREWVQECAVCKRNKKAPHKPYGLLQPLPPAKKPWSDVTMDFIVKLPVGDGAADSILVVVCRMTKMAHFIACNESTNAKGVATLMSMS